MKSPNGTLQAISSGSEELDVTSNDMTVRTSLSHPLRIDELSIDGVTGLIGITFCPGKCGESYDGFRWERDLEKDLNVIADWRADAVVTLIEDHEFEMLGVPQLGEQVRARGIEWHHLPIKDVAPPDARFEEGWVTSGPLLSGILARGGKVLLHCRGGLGRAGTVAARVLIEFDVLPKEAVARVRRARAGAIETQQQMQYVLNLPGARNRKTGELP
jgi:protein-tyrosine phosphatase